MKKIFYLLSIGCLVLLNSCGTSNKTTSVTSKEGNMDSNIITGKKWKLIELNGKAIADKVNGKEPFLQLEVLDNRYSASGGCNGMGGSFTLSDNGRIKFSQGMSTMMACENMEVEAQLAKVLIAADNYTVSNNTLSLNKARMAPLARFQAVEEIIANHLLNGSWELDYVSGAKIAFEGLYPNKKPIIKFNLPDTKATGNSSCNNFNITFTIDGNNIKFSDPASTKMACPGMGEATFFNTLKAVTTYSVSGNTLNLIKGDIAVMRLKKK